MIRFTATGILFFAAVAALTAQQLDPRAYSVSPTGVNIAIASYGYSTGDLSFDPSLPIDSASAQIHNAVAGYFRSINVAGRPANVSIAVPYVFGHLQGKVLDSFTQIYRSGLTDSFARFAVNLYGAKAMKLREFATYRQRTNVGVSVVISTPVGQYDPAKAINVGTNRWSFKPEVGLSHAFRKTRLILDAYAAVWLYTANNNFQGHTRTQEPIYNSQFHLSYDIKPRLWAAFDANFYRGGRTAIDDVERNDQQRNSRIGGTVSVPVAKRQSFKLSYATGAFTTIGGAFQTVSVGYQHLWGGGL
jgi:hypothetical protein